MIINILKENSYPIIKFNLIFNIIFLKNFKVNLLNIIIFHFIVNPTQNICIYIVFARKGEGNFMRRIFYYIFYKNIFFLTTKNIIVAFFIGKLYLNILIRIIINLYFHYIFNFILILNVVGWLF
jgi:hypothetical protein